MRVQQEQQTERRPGATAARPGRSGSRLAELQHTAGNAAVARLLTPSASRTDRAVSVQRITTHPGGTYDAEPQPGERGPHFVAQGPEPRVALGGGGEPRDIRERLRYELAEVGPANAPLRVADDGTLAVHGVDEPKEFYAVQAVVDTANTALRAANSTVELVTGGRSIGVGGLRLLRVQPSVVRDTTPTSQLGPFVSLLRSTCISVACSLIGSEHAKRAQAVLGGGDGGFLLTPNSDSDARANRLADAVAQDTTSSLGLDGAVTAANGGQALGDDLGRRYGEATRDGGRDATEQRLGINKYASPAPGEGFAIFSMLAKDGLDHSVAPAVERGENVWGYHFAAVVARSLDGSCQVTLENYARNEFDAKARSELYEVLYQRAKSGGGWFSQLKPLLESDDQQAFKKKFDEVLAALVTDPEVKRKRGMPRLQLQQDFEDHTCRSWFFRVYGGGPGESFHEQQAASGYFNNPMTLRVARPPSSPDTAGQ
ncbi:hypothetical protein DT019_36475 [Streptomyces sp. SDr-06]|uniref:hypothetical protein n=1 Tax=Streptomyces sp. SDr-06 TaxID=2267702 RepID=UPI000DEB8E68|nr:hypothetical protein [Streptomyces sp. SDr-06]RCH61804.1 hypothetical protein DT019_36475 [Streptomyces sp. SDr-06]